MTKGLKIVTITAILIAAASAAATHLPSNATVAASLGCVPVGDGVCFSGTKEWVAGAMTIQAPRRGVMVAMAGDAI